MPGWQKHSTKTYLRPAADPKFYGTLWLLKQLPICVDPAPFLKHRDQGCWEKCSVFDLVVLGLGLQTGDPKGSRAFTAAGP